MKRIPVMEIFGPTVQGEGMVIGQKTMFVRTGGCDYSCSWCDSAFTWDGSLKATLRTADEIIAKLEEIGGERFSHVTISGGNPALHKGIGELVDKLHDKGIRVALETQGSLWQDWFLKIDDLTISPKPPSSQMKTDFTKLDQIIERLDTKQMSLKVVVFNDEDFRYAEYVHERYPHVPFFLQVGNEDTVTGDNDLLIRTLLDRYEWLIAKATDSTIMNDAKILPQLHTLVWGNKRGV
ncbi:7-carboxy-7-deazaguanine synthase QueE [Halalkalibacterium halodurans]|jgi:7-carboxy-7-deazaguanine synthase|uniref:7-carboxy-7-deazaguanine synthase n=1 Tax=Halalkalibacterium halodurans TaxID=86665 RepID=A0A0M0KJZ3_ALKHA|nr:7-carboxy-7-deazaguanine synthase QueE [Halalkalibacterium halodurans]MDY7222794.1 7-carboxy-7-deazaguanine synthase QueE [Halalkalibacterium halodurans]MDY7242015.1 7-carboxy-7-deazaguanine synthase QueE [Halalkalibacterium halodurans]MED4080974.1 7-carboxy-7-deazaguanine synthase QueE [Halalkalibacterium halodurans]MED4085157.1 7-carboxy-7-deazaguanine synthase QueE [Halalkalibacterium halodurans]MED4105265.1 7-carboxy-7-deazaguanine synthase QueE [Halalkalibacterium halodurans]